MKQKGKFFIFILSLTLLVVIAGKTASAQTNQFDKDGLRKPTVTYVTKEEASDVFLDKNATYYKSEWESYSTYYYYNQMNTNERALYDKLNTMCLSYLTGTTDLSTGYTQYCSYSGLTAQEALNVSLIFTYSNPQYYYLSKHFARYYYQNDAQLKQGYIALGVYDAFKNGQDRKNATTAMKKQIDSYVALIQKEDSPLNKEKKANDLIAKNVVYERSTYDQSAYSVFMEGKTVCAGYAAAFSILMNAVNIDTTVVTSDSHAWNYIRLNDSWYNVDTTWNDIDERLGVSTIYLFFNRSNENITASDKTTEHIPESLWNGLLPSCTLDSGATLNSVGELPDATSDVNTPVIKSQKVNNKHVITLSTTTPNATIYYTTNGGRPSSANTKAIKYTGSFTTTNNCTIKAIAVSNEYYDSSVTSATLSADAPILSKNPASKTYSYGASTTATSLSVKASSPDGGKLTYQWYRSSTKKNSGGTAIKNATSSSYKPSISKAGTTYYYCVITNTTASALTTKSVSKASGVATIKVNAASISKMKLTGLSTKTYTGKSICPSLKVKLGSKTLCNKKDYTITFKNNKSIGKATVTIKGIGNYKDSRTYSFTIKPKNVTLSSVTAQKKALKVNWKKSSSITGYKIQYSTNKNFKNASSVRIKSSKTTSYTIKKLKTKKTYYIRIQCYKTVNGKNYYSSWSAVKSKKTR